MKRILAPLFYVTAFLLPVLFANFAHAEVLREAIVSGILTPEGTPVPTQGGQILIDTDHAQMYFAVPSQGQSQLQIISSYYVSGYLVYIGQIGTPKSVGQTLQVTIPVDATKPHVAAYSARYLDNQGNLQERTYTFALRPF
jgi:hypothetical protein